MNGTGNKKAAEKMPQSEKHLDFYQGVKYQMGCRKSRGFAPSNRQDASKTQCTENTDRSAVPVLEFFVPGHLDGFELGFVGGGGIAGEAGELGDPFVHVGEADR